MQASGRHGPGGFRTYTLAWAAIRYSRGTDSKTRGYLRTLLRMRTRALASEGLSTSTSHFNVQLGVSPGRVL